LGQIQLKAINAWEKKDEAKHTFTLMFNFALGKTKTFVFLQRKGKKFKRKEQKKSSKQLFFCNVM
jgi:hypothetical protein